jgi:hypothetical protein
MGTTTAPWRGSEEGRAEKELPPRKPPHRAAYPVPQQKLISKVRDGAKITKRYDPAQTPYARAIAHPKVKELPRRRLTAQHASFNPAAVQRQIQALCGQLLTVATAKNQPTTKPTVAAPAPAQPAAG